MARAGFLGDYGNRKCHDKRGGGKYSEDKVRRQIGEGGKIEMKKGRRRRLKESGRGRKE